MYEHENSVVALGRRNPIYSCNALRTACVQPPSCRADCRRLVTLVHFFCCPRLACEGVKRTMMTCAGPTLTEYQKGVVDFADW